MLHMFGEIKLIILIILLQVLDDIYLSSCFTAYEMYNPVNRANSKFRIIEVVK